MRKRTPPKKSPPRKPIGAKTTKLASATKTAARARKQKDAKKALRRARSAAPAAGGASAKPAPVVHHPRGERTPRRNAEERRIVGANAPGPWDDGRVDRGPDKGSTDRRERQPVLPQRNYDKDWGDDDLGGRTDPSDVK